MTDIIFEEPPKRGKRSAHFDLLLALKGHPKRDARVQVDMDEKEANKLASAVRTAASKLGDGFVVTARYIPETGKHGVWVRYEPAVGDEPPTQEQAHAEASALIRDAAKQGLPDPDDDLDPIGDDDEWETPPRSKATA